MCSTRHVMYMSCMKVACNSIASRTTCRPHSKQQLNSMTKSHTSVSHLYVQAQNLYRCLKKPNVSCFPDYMACMQDVTAGLQCPDSAILSALQSHASQSRAMHDISCVCRHLVERTEGDAHTAAVDECLGRPGPLGMVQRQKKRH